MDKGKIKEVASFTLVWSIFVMVASVVISIGGWIAEKIYDKISEWSEKRKERKELREEIKKRRKEEATP